MDSISLCPTEIRFMHAKIKCTFACGRSVNETIEKIYKGKMNIRKLPRIKVVFRNNKYYAFDNRRLYVYRVLHRRGKLPKVTVWLADESKYQQDKFSSKNDGSYVIMKKDSTLPHSHATRVINVPKKKGKTSGLGSSKTQTFNVSGSSENDSTAEAKDCYATKNLMLHTIVEPVSHKQILSASKDDNEVLSGKENTLSSNQLQIVNDCAMSSNATNKLAQNLEVSKDAKERADNSESSEIACTLEKEEKNVELQSKSANNLSNLQQVMKFNVEDDENLIECSDDDYYLGYQDDDDDSDSSDYYDNDFDLSYNNYDTYDQFVSLNNDCDDFDDTSDDFDDFGDSSYF